MRRKFEDDERESPHEESMGHDLRRLYGDVEFFDDVIGGILDKALMIEARKLEMAFFQRMGVYTKVDRSEALRVGGKVIKTKWVDLNKGDDKEPNMRARLVG